VLRDVYAGQLDIPRRSLLAASRLRPQSTLSRRRRRSNAVI